jgi:hypothetical protein
VWRLGKKIKSGLAKTLFLKRKRLEAAGKHYDFFVYGKPVDWEAVEKSFRRRNVGSDDVHWDDGVATQSVDGLVMVPRGVITSERHVDENSISCALRKAL